jgi:PAS domain S-box-containing protein
MPTGESDTCDQDELRARAEEILDEAPPDWLLEEADRTALIQELRIHQTELEVQNQELREAQERLESSRQRYADLFDLAPVAYLVLDRRAMILEANQAAADLFRTDRDLLLGHPLAPFIGEGGREAFFRHIHEALMSLKSVQADLVFRRRGGEEWPGEMRSVPVADSEEEPRILASVSDLTERIRIQRALENQRRRLFALLEELPAAVCLVDSAQQVHFTNRAFRGIFGEAAGRPMPELFRSVDAPDLPRPPARVLATQQPRTWERVLPDGRVHLVHDYPFQEEGQAARVLQVALDISEARRAREAMVHAEQMAAVEMLAGGVAHEFNNLHGGAMGYLEILVNDPEIGTKNRERLLHVHRALERAASVTQGLLDFARRKFDAAGPGDLGWTVGECLRLLEPRLLAAGIASDVRVADPAPVVAMETAALSQVALNLLINAHHAMLDSAEKRLTVEVVSEKETGVLRIGDTGCGISPEALGRLFLPFYTTKGSAARPGSAQSEVRGTGLGLSVTHTLVQNHGGRIDVEGAPGEGATFTVRLPLADRPARAPEPPRPTA